MKNTPNISFAGTIKTEKILEFMKKHNLTEEQFAEKCKLDVKELRKILRNHSYFEPIWLLKIARTMSVDFSDLVKD